MRQIAQGLQAQVQNPTVRNAFAIGYKANPAVVMLKPCVIQGFFYFWIIHACFQGVGECTQQIQPDNPFFAKPNFLYCICVSAVQKCLSDGFLQAQGPGLGGG